MPKLSVSCVLAAVFTVPAVHAACWQPVLGGSKIIFTASQAGAPMQGTFHQYDAKLCLDGTGGTLQVSVQTASVDTQLAELDDALRGEDFFDAKRWPTAVFQSDSLKSLGNGRYQLTGKLTIRDQTREITLPFTWTPAPDGNSAMLVGQFALKRLDYKVGQGQWADTQWVGDPVGLAFSILFKSAAAKSSSPHPTRP